MTSYRRYPTNAVTVVPQFTNHNSRGRKLLPLIAALTVILAMVGLSSCSGYTTTASAGGSGGTGTGQAGVLSPNSASVAFGSVAVGSAGTQSVTVTNTGTAAVSIAAATITGAGFTIVGGNPSASVPVGQSMTVQMQFTPTAGGVASGTLTVTSDASNSPLAISLSGTGMQQALTISPASLNFSNVMVGQTSSQNVTLTNSGNANVTVNIATLSGTAFGMTGLALPKTIAAGSNLSFSVQFVPTSTAGASGRIVFTDSALNSPQTLTMTGSAVASGSTLGANPGSFNFGNVAVNSSSQQTFTLTNSGNATITINQVSTTGGGFSSTGLTIGQKIAAGANATFTSTFAPTTAVAASGSVTILSTATNSTLTISLSGTGTQGGLSANPASIAFGAVLDGASASVPVTLTNTGTAAVSITAHSITGTGFTLTGWTAPASLTAGQTTSFTVTFAPTTGGSKSGSVSITSNAPGSPLVINLSGSGTATQATMTTNPSPVVFNNVNVGSNSTQTVTLTNTGNAALNISAATISGSGYTMSLTAPKTIDAGANAQFTVKFAPTASGSSAGSIQIISNAVGSPATISLSGTGVATQSTMTVNPSPLAFNNINVGSNLTQTVTLTNTGNAALNISAATISGSGYTMSLTAPKTIDAGANAQFTVKFAPTTSGSSAGSIQITSNAVGSPATISLSGTGLTTQSSMTVNPSPVPFNNINVGSNSTQTVTLTNTGNAALNISAATISGSGYTMSLTAPKTINAGANAQFTVKFAPTTSGSSAGSIQITSNAVGSPATISLSGTGVTTQSTMTVNPSPVAFNNVNVGSNLAQTVTLTNTGNAALNISTATISGSGYTMNLTAPKTINAGANTQFTVTFTPTASGSSAGSIQITSNAPGSPATISLSGTGMQAQLAASPTSAVFSSVVVGNSNSQPITLRNNGNMTLSFSNVVVAGAGMGVSGLTASTKIAAGGNMSFNAVFTPTSAGAINGSVTLTTNGTSSPMKINLSGTGVAATQALTANPTSLGFGTVNLNTSSSLTSTLTNTGNSNITISGLTTTGAGFSGNGVSNGTILTPGQTATLTVTFDPTTAGAVTGASASVGSNAAGSPTIVTLSGTGRAAATHSVLLQWDASVTAGVNGYNVYRATASGGYGTTPLNSTPVSAMTFTDTTVTSGQSYFYVVTAVDTGQASSDSNEVSVSIP
jgi:Cep192 domain 4/Abnormal spindle-like microcephaly-assoc'd, ASPM-SPD-2-Hydin/HYDIN/CFA65/VesB-like, Ig-like domain